MGGLLAADTLREFVNSRPDAKAPLWPKIIACIAFDTPVNSSVCISAIELNSVIVLRFTSFRCQERRN